MGVQNVPAQQAGAAGSHVSPAPAHCATPPSLSMGRRQTVRPGSPPQNPLQQSSLTAHAAPTGTQAERQERMPLESGTQRCEQH